MVVLLNILMHSWETVGLPHPWHSTIARRMGAGARTVQQAFEFLEKKQLLRRLLPEKGTNGPTICQFDLSGLVEIIQELELLVKLILYVTVAKGYNVRIHGEIQEWFQAVDEYNIADGRLGWVSVIVVC